MTYIPPPAAEPMPVDTQMRVWTYLAGIIFFLVITLSFGNAVIEFIRKDVDPLPGELSAETFMSGKISSDIAKSLKKISISETSGQWQRYFAYKVWGDLGTDVRLGQSGWLFLSDEFVTHEHAGEHARARIQDVVEVEKLLANKGIRLHVLLIPDKSRVESQHLGPLQRPESFSPRVSEFASGLKNKQIQVLDLSSAFNAQVKKESLFLKADSHWNEVGAQLAAQLIAQNLINQGCQPSPKMNVTASTKQQVNRPGDLVRLAGLDTFSAKQSPASDDTPVSTFTYVSAGQAQSKPEDDLFGNQDLPNIALVGTSYSNTSQFSDFIAMALKTKLGNFAKDGGDFSGSMNVFLNSSAFKETPPKCVIWEIPERVIQKDRSNDKLKLP